VSRSASKHFLLPVQSRDFEGVTSQTARGNGRTGDRRMKPHTGNISKKLQDQISST